LCGTSRGPREGLWPIKLEYVILKYLYLKLFNFVKGNARKKYYKIRQLKKIINCTKRRYSQIKPQLKVKKEDGRIKVVSYIFLFILELIVTSI